MAQRRAALRAELQRVLSGPGPLALELGCGHGHFLARYATENPARTFVGVDLRSDRIVRAQRKANRAGLRNCHFVRAEAVECLRALPQDVVVEEVWVLFPDPWPKKRHHKNRLLQPGFFETIAAYTPTGTRLYFRTDFGPYFDAVSAFLPDLATWQPDPCAVWPAGEETVFQARAESFQSLVAVRTSHPATLAERAAPTPPPPATPT